MSLIGNAPLKRPTDIMKEWFVSWANKNANYVDILICFGSFGRGDASASSDLDIAIGGKIYMDAIAEALAAEFDGTICYSIHLKNKLLALVPFDSCVVKIDCFVVDHIERIKMYILGSEMPASNLETKIILYCNPVSGQLSLEWLKELLTSQTSPTVIELNEEISKHIKQFLESFEAAANKRAVSDKFQFIYQMFLAYNSLIKLEYVRNGGVRFLYLPKQVLSSFPNNVRRRFEDELEPKGRLNHGFALQKAYLLQFFDTVSGLLATADVPSEWWERIGMPNFSIHKLELILSKVLERGRWYNFRDISTLGSALKSDLVYRSGYNPSTDFLKEKKFATVIDLRTENEISLKKKLLNDAIHVDLFSCGGWQQGDTFDYTWFAEAGRGGLGLIFRSLLSAPLPVLIHCVAGRDRTGVVVALLQCLCGASRADIISEYCMSHQGVKESDIIMFLDLIGNDSVSFFLSLGLSAEEIVTLKSRFKNDITMVSCERESPLTETETVNKIDPVIFEFLSGEPSESCRPYLPCEIAAMNHHLMGSVNDPQQYQSCPIAVFITGLPGSGKSTILKKVLVSIGLEESECVNLDMDIVRSFHCQYQYFRHQRTSSPYVFQSYQDLVSWLNKGPTNLEDLVYRNPDSVVRQLLAKRRHFVLPGVMQYDSTLTFMRHCLSQGYKLCLVGVHVDVDTAMRRVAKRASRTGRFTPTQLIHDSSETTKSFFARASEFVYANHGDILLCNNESESFTIAYSCLHDTISMNDMELSSKYLTSHLLEPNSSNGNNSNNNNISSSKNCNTVSNDLTVVIEEGGQSSQCKIVTTSSISLAEEFAENGFVALQSCIDNKVVIRLGLRFEECISTFASDNGMTREDYTSVINKWPHCNCQVMDIMEELSPLLRREVAATLNSTVAWPVGAILFRKASDAADAGNIPTHPHQDISYSRFAGSQMFRATTWIPLLLENADTLAFAKKSHKLGIAKVADFLNPLEAREEPPTCNDIVPVSLGDCLLFDARTWHKSTPFPTDKTGAHCKSLRLAIGIQWLTPGGLDGIIPGEYFRYPDKDVPDKVSISDMRDKHVFGIDTAGFFLKRALVRLVDEMGLVTVDRNSTLGMAETVLAPSHRSDMMVVLGKFGCDYEQVHCALRRYVLFRRAGRFHFGEAQGTKIFAPLRESFIKHFQDLICF